MKPGEIKDLVEKNWIFSNDNYPILENLSRSQKRIFALNHILKHQSKGILFLLHGQKDSHEMVEGIQKVLFNSLRFALLLGISVEDLRKAIAKWNFPTDSNSSNRKIGGSLHQHAYFLQYMRYLQRSVNQAFQILEPCDHGARLEKTALTVVAKEMLTTSIGLAEVAAIRRIEFYEWLATLNKKNGFAP